MKDMYIDYSRNRSRKKKKIWLTALILVMLAIALGLGAYFFAASLSEQAENDRKKLTQTENNSPAADLDDSAFYWTPDMETAVWDNSDNNTAVSEDSAGSTPADGPAVSDPEENTDGKMNFASNDSYGIYGLWTEPEAEDVPEKDPYAEDVWMGDFVDTRKRVDAKGIYISAAYLSKKLDDAINLVDTTELNTMVIDIKGDNGYITYMMDNETAREIGALTSTVTDINAMVNKLKEHNIYLIARVVSLRDPLLAEKKPELALKNKNGTIFRDSSGLAWVNPYEDRVWDYLTDICVRCVEAGFDEVNLDYIRFSTDKGMADVDFGPKAEKMSRVDVITDEIRKLCEIIKPMGAFISCDVYGAIISSSVDAKIVGQSYFNMAKYLDYICPMVYPSHYGDGYYNLDYPDCHPYDLVLHALRDSQKVLYMLDPEENKADVRPWLQDFTATWLPHHLTYGKTEIRDQINAVYDSGYTQWFLWNAAVSYTKDGLNRE